MKMNWAEVKKINSDMNTPLDATLGKRGDAAGTAGTTSLFGWMKATYNFVSGTLNTAVSNITGVVRGPRRQTFTANGTFTVPAGVTQIWVDAISAGGDGGSTSAIECGGGAQNTPYGALVGIPGKGAPGIDIIRW